MWKITAVLLSVLVAASAIDLDESEVFDNVAEHESDFSNEEIAHLENGIDSESDESLDGSILVDEEELHEAGVEAHDSEAELQSESTFDSAMAIEVVDDDDDDDDDLADGDDDDDDDDDEDNDSLTQDSNSEVSERRRGEGRRHGQLGVNENRGRYPKKWKMGGWKSRHRGRGRDRESKRGRRSRKLSATSPPPAISDIAEVATASAIVDTDGNDYGRWFRSPRPHRMRPCSGRRRSRCDPNSPSSPESTPTRRAWKPHKWTTGPRAIEEGEATQPPSQTTQSWWQWW